MAEFKLGDMVLVKWNVEGSIWAPQEYIGVGQTGLIFFSDGTGVSPKDVTIIPLTEDTIKYLGSTQDIPVPWEPKLGELVAVKDKRQEYWYANVFIRKVGDGYECADSTNTNRGGICWEQCEPLHKHFNVPKCPENV